MSDSSATASLLAQLKDLNAEQLRRLLVEHLTRQKLGLYWESNAIERDKALNAHVILPRVVPELCQPPIKAGAEDAIAAAPFENLIIEGDNFDSLRLLRATHRSKIRVIYIDPPYNTGNKDWVYNDRYVGQNDRWRHSQWLEFLYVRLTLARDLLTPDGVIMVSINDENRARLELLMDEVFPGRRLGSFVWKTRSGSNDETGAKFSVDHEHVLAYANPGFAFNGVLKDFSQYKNPDGDPRGPWKTGDLSKSHSFIERRNGYYPIQNPTNGVWYPCNPNRVWAFASESVLADTSSLQAKTMEQYIREGKVIFPDALNERVVVWKTKEELLAAIDSGNVPTRPKSKLPLLTRDIPDLDFWIGKPVGFGRPWFKRHRADLQSDVRPVSSWIRGASDDDCIDEFVVSLISQRSGTGEHSANEILGFNAFPFPKPSSLLQNLLRQTTQTNDIVLDFFAGSGTTGQAVLDLNVEDGGNRRFILCSSTEVTDKEPNKNICRDVCAARMRRVMTGYGDKPGLGGSFAYLQLDATEPADVPFDASTEHARTLLSLRFAQQALPPPTKETAVQLIARGHGVDILLCMDVTDEAIAALAAWPSERIAVYSPRPETVAELLHARGRDVNSYSLYEALVQGQARAKQARAVATETTSTAA